MASFAAVQKVIVILLDSSLNDWLIRTLWSRLRYSTPHVVAITQLCCLLLGELLSNLDRLCHKLLPRLEDHLNGERAKAPDNEHSEPKLRQYDVEDDAEEAANEEERVDYPDRVVVDLGLVGRLGVLGPRREEDETNYRRLEDDCSGDRNGLLGAELEQTHGYRHDDHASADTSDRGNSKQEWQENCREYLLLEDWSQWLVGADWSRRAGTLNCDHLTGVVGVIDAVLTVQSHVARLVQLGAFFYSLHYSKSSDR